MPLSFFLVLFTYLAVAAACVRANTTLTAGLISTSSLGIVLFSGIVAWNYGRRRPFWIGFFVFFSRIASVVLLAGKRLLLLSLSRKRSGWSDRRYIGVQAHRFRYAVQGPQLLHACGKLFRHHGVWRDWWAAYHESIATRY